MKRIISTAVIYMIFQISLMAQPKMKCPDIIDFGTVMTKTDPYRTFVYYNIGTEPLVITNAKASSGYLVPKWPKEPLFPGDSAVFEIRYDTRRLGAFSKKISIRTNEGEERVVKVIGEIQLENGTSFGSVKSRKKIYFSSGFEYSRSKRYAIAIDYFEKAIALDPNYAIAYHCRGLCKSNLGRKHAAIDDFTKSIDLDPLFTDSYLYRGLAKFGLEQYRETIPDLTKAVNGDPTNADAFFIRAVAYERTDQYKKSIADYTKVIDLKPNSAKAYRGRAIVKSIIEYGDYQGAIADYTKVIELQPDNGETYHNRGLVKTFLRDFQGAIKDYDQAISISNTDSDFYESRGMAKYFFGKKEEACLDFYKAKELGSTKVLEDIEKFCN